MPWRYGSERERGRERDTLCFGHLYGNGNTRKHFDSCVPAACHSFADLIVRYCFERCLINEFKISAILTKVPKPWLGNYWNETIVQKMIFKLPEVGSGCECVRFRQPKFIPRQRYQNNQYKEGRLNHLSPQVFLYNKFSGIGLNQNSWNTFAVREPENFFQLTI